MIEQAVSFGKNNNILGVLSSPANHPKPYSLPGVIIFNSGLIHKVGPFRLNTEVSREIAQKGFEVLRFDLSGIGDSRINFNKGDRWEKAIADAKDAMDYMEHECHVKGFVLIGLCSGSDNSHRISLVEKRVVGSIHLDGYSYRNLKYYAKYYGGRITSTRLLRKKVKENLRKTFSKTELVSLKNDIPPIAYIDRGFPPKNTIVNDFRALVSRNVKMFYIFTGGVEEYNNYKEQLRDSLADVDFLNCLDLEFFPCADHTYSTLASRKRVIITIVDWLESNFHASF